MTDLAAKAAGTLTETAVKAVAKKAKTAVAKRIPTRVNKAAKAVAQAAKAPKKTAKEKNREEDRHKINEKGCEEIRNYEKQKDGAEIQCSISEEGKAKIKEVGILKIPIRASLPSLAR